MVTLSSTANTLSMQVYLMFGLARLCEVYFGE